MNMFKSPIPKLGPEDIEVKVKQVSEKGAVALLYKTARTDMRILDECAGPENWQDEYREIKGNLYCTIKVRNPETGEWVGKTDCGIESREDDEGNQKKGEASDAFKRAGFKWGIGRELYTAPFIFLAVETKKAEGSGRPRFELTNRFARFFVKSIDYDDSGCIKSVVIVDDKGNQVYPRGKAPVKNEDKPDLKPASAMFVNTEQITAMAKEMTRTGKDISFILKQINTRFKVSVQQVEQVTIEQYNWVIAKLKKTADAPKKSA